MTDTNLYTLSALSSKEQYFESVRFTEQVAKMAEFYTPARPAEFISRLVPCVKQLTANLASRCEALHAEAVQAMHAEAPEEDETILSALADDAVKHFKAFGLHVIMGFAAKPLHLAMDQGEGLEYLNSWSHREAYVNALEQVDMSAAHLLQVFFLNTELSRQIRDLLRFVSRVNYPNNDEHEVKLYRALVCDMLAQIYPAHVMLGSLRVSPELFKEELAGITQQMASRASAQAAAKVASQEALNPMPSPAQMMQEIKSLQKRVHELEHRLGLTVSDPAA